MFLIILVNSLFLPGSCPMSSGDLSNFFTSYIPHSDYTDFLHFGLSDKTNLKAEELENLRGRSSYVSSGRNESPKFETYQNFGDLQHNFKNNSKENANISAALSNSSNNSVTKSPSGGIMNFFSGLIGKTQNDIKANPVNPEPIKLVRPMNSSENKIGHWEKAEKGLMLANSAVVRSGDVLREALKQRSEEDARAGKHRGTLLLPGLHNEVGKYDFANASVADIDDAINKFLDDYGVGQLNSALRRLRPSGVLTPDGCLLQPLAYIDRPKQNMVGSRNGSNAPAKDCGMEQPEESWKKNLGNQFEECNLTQRIEEYEKAHPELLLGRNQTSKRVQEILASNSFRSENHNFSCPSEESKPLPYIIHAN